MSVMQFRERLLSSYYVLRPGYSFYFPTPNEMHVRGQNWGESLVRVAMKEGEDWISEALLALDGSRTARDLLSIVPQERHEDFLKLIAALRRDYLYEGLEPLKLEGDWKQKLFSTRQTAMYWYNTALEGADVLIFGAGALGSRTATTLVQSGIARVTVVDAKQVSEEDRLLTPAFVGADAGEFRAEALAAFLQKIPSRTTVEGVVVEAADEALLSQLMAGRSLVLVLEDVFSPVLYERVNRAAMQARIRWSMAQMDGWDLYVGPTFLPGETGCYHCMEAVKIETMKQPSSYLRYVDSLQSGVQEPAFNGGPAFADLAAGLLASDLPNLIGIMPERIEMDASLTIGRRMHMDLRTFDAALIPVHKLPRCPACSQASTVLQEAKHGNPTGH